MIHPPSLPRVLIPVLALCLIALLAVAATRAVAWEMTIKESTSCLNVFDDLDVENLLDNDPTTCWAECADGPGVGESVTFDFGESVVLQQLGIANGCQGEGDFESHNRVAQVEVVYANGARERFDLADRPGLQFLPLTPMSTTSLTLVITKATLADSLFDRGQTCLSEVQFVTRVQADDKAGDKAPEAAPEIVEEPAEETAEEVAAAPQPDPIPDVVPDPVTEPVAPEQDNDLALPAEEPALKFSATASSALTTELGGLSFSADNLVDGSKRTAWVEGVPGPGVGEWAEITLPVRKPLAGIWIANGCQAGERTFEANNRAKILDLALSSGDTRPIKVEDAPGLQFVDLGDTMTESLRLTIREVYTGGDGEHTCLAEVRPSYVGAGQAVADMDEETLGTPEERALGVVRAFYTRLITLDDGYVDLYAGALRDDEELIFEVFRETQKQRGMYQLFRQALVDLDDLGMSADQVSDDEIKVVVDGFYTVYVGPAFERIDENTVFTLIYEDAHWRIMDKQEL